VISLPASTTRFLPEGSSSVLNRVVRGQWLLALCLLISGYSPGLQADPEFQPLIDNCLLRLAWESSPEHTAILAEACPLLLDELQTRGLDSTVEGAALEDLTANQLSLYLDTTALWGAAEQRGVVPLGPVLAELHVEDFAKRSLFDQFKDWLASFFPDGTEESIESLIRRILPDFDISDTTWSFIGDLIMAAIIAGAIAIVVIELFRSGLFSSPNARSRRMATPATPQPPLSHAHPALTPTALFERLTQLITERFGRPDASSLSHRETGTLVAGLAVLPASTHQELVRFVSDAERIRYGAWTPDSAQQEAVLKSGQIVLQALNPKSQA